MTEVSRGGAAVSSLGNQSQGGLGDRFRGSAWGELPLSTAPLVAISWGLLELRRQRREIQGINVLERAHWIHGLEAFYLSLASGNPRGCLRGRS